MHGDFQLVVVGQMRCVWWARRVRLAFIVAIMKLVARTLGYMSESLISETSYEGWM